MFGVSRYQICRLDLPTCLTTGRRMYYQPSDVLAVLQARCAAEYGSAITALVVAAARLDALLEADE